LDVAQIRGSAAVATLLRLFNHYQQRGDKQAQEEYKSFIHEIEGHISETGSPYENPQLQVAHPIASGTSPLGESPLSGSDADNVANMWGANNHGRAPEDGLDQYSPNEPVSLHAINSTAASRIATNLRMEENPWE
jgi:hypothetical protein